MKLSEIAARIDAHLRRWERDPAINTLKHGMHRLFRAHAYASGSRVFVLYATWIGPTSFTKAKALAYLAWIEAGNVGEHYHMVPSNGIPAEA